MDFHQRLYPYTLAVVNIGFGWLLYASLDYSGGILSLTMGILVLFTGLYTAMDKHGSPLLGQGKQTDI